MGDTVRIDLLDPTTRLHPVSTGGTGSLIEDLRDDCGLVIQGIDWVVRKVSSYDLIAAIFEPISGDFAAVEQIADRWTYASYAMGDLGANYGALADATPEIWTGKAARAAIRKLDKLAGGLDLQREVLDLGAECLRCVLTTVESVCHGVAALLSLVDDLVIKLVAGGWGWLREIATGGETVRKVISYIDDAISLIKGLDELIPKVIGWFGEIGAILALSESAIAFLSAAVTAGPGHKVDDVAGRGQP